MRPCKIADHCQHPVAQVWLRDDPNQMTPVLSAGTDYRIELNLELPESETNFDVGMFMASVEMQTRNGRVLKAAQRSGVLVYRSSLLKFLNTMLTLPSLLLGEGKEKQLVRLTMFDSFVDLPRNDLDFAAVAYIELHTTDIQIYSARLRIYADFGGLRYLMYQWPLTTAAIGFFGNFVTLWIATALYWIRSQLFSIVKLITRRKTTSTLKSKALSGPFVNEVDIEVTDVTKPRGALQKIIYRVPFIQALQSYVAILVDIGLRWSPVPIPGTMASVQKSKAA
ncbi:seipin-like [Tropilaelaps mercedesae]|uniref:Seipin n=1 Tax=Tropilaelaps mercedesae TaxID=418985 RepID=A0A1V9XJS6_9ACAR|nr:seipin-like [Tropilaelaps mercedesae]